MEKARKSNADDGLLLPILAQGMTEYTQRREIDESARSWQYANL